MANFSTQVSDWVAKSKLLTEAVFRMSADQIINDEMNVSVGNGGNVPFDTGFLHHSLMASTSTMPKIDPAARPAKGASYGYDSGPVSLVINNADLGQTIYAGYTAAYAARQNYGFTGTDSLGRHYSQSGRLFVEKAAQKWPTVVASVEAKLKARLG
jgi:hypothetical protein